MPEESYDPYPPFTQDDFEWFEGVLAEIVGSRDDVLTLSRVRGGLDLQIVFTVTPSKLDLFTPEVYVRLREQLAERTDVLKPVVYEENHPHPEAKEALNYVARGGC